MISQFLLLAALLISATDAVVAELIGVLGVGWYFNNEVMIKLLKQRNKKKEKLQDDKNRNDNEKSKLEEELEELAQKLGIKQQEIEKEESKIFKVENLLNDESTKFMVAMGMTGDGKSTVLNRLTGDDSEDGGDGPFEAGYGDQSVTQAIKHAAAHIGGQQSILVDTPGYKDTRGRDNTHFNNLSSYLYGSGGIDAIILVLSGSNPRFDGNLQDMLKYYESYFGPKLWDHLVVILTHIEGAVKKSFHEANGDKKLQDNLKMHFGAIDPNLDIPVVTIGKDCENQQVCEEEYAAFREKLISKVHSISNDHAKLECTEIKSPIKKLRKDREVLTTQRRKLERRFKNKEKRSDALEYDIMKLQEKIDNPEVFPLLTNWNAEI